MQSARQIARLNELELEKCVPPNASWHTDYRDTAYIYIGGLPFDLSEGDVLTIFSQFGNPVHVNLARDKETGKSRGFAWLKYEDQRSCDLAVDNLSGGTVLGRTLGVDHARYKLKEGEVEGAGMESDVDDGADDTDREGESRGKKRRKSESGSEEEMRRPMLKEEVELATLMREHEDDDPMKKYLVEQKKEEIADALKRLDVAKKDGGEKKHRHRHRHHRDENGDSRKDRHRSRRDRSEDGEDVIRHERRTKHRSSKDDDRDGDRRRDEKHRSRRHEGREDDRKNGHSRSRRSRSPDDGGERRRRHRSEST